MILERLRRGAEALRRAHPEIEQIQLVGSLVRGGAMPGSDADLLIVLNESSLPFHERIGRLLRDWPPSGIAVDLLPFTRRELEARLASADPFITELLRQRQELLAETSAAPHAPDP